MYTEIDPATSMDIWVLDLPQPVSAGASRETAAQSRPFLKTPFSENEPTLSPDGRWLAYQSNESGRFEVYVRSFPMPARRTRFRPKAASPPRGRLMGIFSIVRRAGC